MRTGGKSALARFALSMRQTWKLWTVALVSFLCGALLAARLVHLQDVRAQSNHVFQLMVYHTYPDKEPELENIFRDVSKLQEKHNLHVLGYWVPNEDPAWKDTFVYIVDHPSLEEARKNWDALHTDPVFLPYRRAAAPLIRQVNGRYDVDEVYMRPTAFSELK